MSVYLRGMSGSAPSKLGDSSSQRLSSFWCFYLKNNEIELHHLVQRTLLDRPRLYDFTETRLALKSDLRNNEIYKVAEFNLRKK